MNASTFFSTDRADRYLGTLCKHFGHKVPVRHDKGTGQIELPFGLCVLSADETGLALSVEASDKSQLDKTIKVISSHLERFAFRENPDLTWTVANGTNA
ncbi:DUF2218 domain-containing protein [Antarctobacter sp.]|uniref:DUF2218 domain-containing protein n=1 Tax=Antarctobacter sp. TaxID=1872577 RepID=UPI002B27A0F4|nr:DUF2218 domain-containing protein [Antarctobacter sp.]